MSNLGTTIRADELPEDDRGDFTPLPAGEYQVAIDAADVFDTKAGTGQYIKLRLRVEGPTHAGRILFANVNIRNPSADAERIGRADLRKIMVAIGTPEISDTQQMMGGQMIVKVTVKNSEQYGPENDVRGYRAVGASMPAATPVSTAAATAAVQMPSAAPAPQAAAPAAQRPTTAAPPWARKG